MPARARHSRHPGGGAQWQKGHTPSFNWHLPGGTPMASWMASLTSLMVALDSTDTVMFWPFSGNSEPSMAGTATVTETGGF